MCDASDYVVGAVLGQSMGKKQYAISYAGKTLTGPQLNCATTEKELLVVVFAIEKSTSYLVGAKVIIYIDLQIRDKKGVENSVANHLSRIQFEEFAKLPMKDYMRDDTLLKVSTIDPWYANIVNYIVASYIPPWANKKYIIRDSRLHLWDDPYLYQVCADGRQRRCIPAFETWKYLSVVIHHHMKGTMELSSPMLRCGKVVSIGQQCMMTPNHLFDTAADVRSMGISM
jgi:hypothetical protein